MRGDEVGIKLQRLAEMANRLFDLAKCLKRDAYIVLDHHRVRFQLEHFSVERDRLLVLLCFEQVLGPLLANLGLG